MRARPAVFGLLSVLGVAQTSTVAAAPIVPLQGVSDLEVADDTLYLAGVRQLGTPTGRVVRLHGSRLRHDRTYPTVDGGDVLSAVPDTTGGVFLAGTFTHVGGRSAPYLAHITADGRVDRQFRPPLATGPSHVAFDGTTVYSSLGDGTVDAFASDGTRRWSASGDAGAFVVALAATGGRVVISTRSVVGDIRRLVVRDAADGSLAPWQPAIDTARSLIRYDDQRLLIGGVTSIDARPRRGLALVDLTTGTVDPFDPEVPFAVTAVGVGPAGEILAGGSASRGIGMVALYDRPTASTPRWVARPRGVHGPQALALARNRVFVGTRSGVVAIGAVNARVDGTFRPRLAVPRVAPDEPSQPIRALVATPGGVIVGGAIYGVDAIRRFGLAAVDLRSLRPLDGLPVAAANELGGVVSALAHDADHLYVGGFFDMLQGPEQRQSLAAIDLDTRKLTPWKPRVDSTVEAITVANGYVYVGGQIRRLNGRPRQPMGAFGTATGSLARFNPGLRNVVTVRSIDVSASGVYGLVVTQTQRRVLRFEPGSGRVDSRFAPTAASAMVATDACVWTVSDRLRCLAPRTGKVRHELRIAATAIARGPRDTLLVGVSAGRIPTRGAVLVLDGAAGRVLRRLRVPGRPDQIATGGGRIVVAGQNRTGAFLVVR